MTTIKTDELVAYWEAVGRERGRCGHRHRSFEAAERCALRDMRRLGSYTDRHARAYTRGGREVPLAGIGL